jgi:histidinol dehydrogenase
MKIQQINTTDGDLEQRLDELRGRLSPSGDVVSEKGRQRTIQIFGEPLSPRKVVQRICQDVHQEGIEAVLRYTKQLDNALIMPATLRVPAADLAAAHKAADPAFLSTIRRIRENIREFQTAVLHQDVEVRRPGGITLRQRYLPLQRVGLCIPGGAAAYPSTVLMTAVPAQVAGVEELAVVAPPTPFGANNPDLLATCHELGIQEVYRVGGAQGVAALAYGVAGLPPVDKIVGPGNLFVALAKQHVYGQVDIDSIAGPSEVVVLADETTRADFAAADLLAQAEHAPGASILITWHEPTLRATLAELQRQVTDLSRCELTVQSLEEFGVLILARDADEACEITNRIAPEHLHIAVDDPHKLAAKTRFAGAIFLGHYSPVALGDYAAGPSHVLPTSGTARWASGLSANDFLRGNSVIEYSQAALIETAADVQMMADKEQLTAHRASIDIRLPK